MSLRHEYHVYHEIEEHELIHFEERPLPPVPNYHTDAGNEEWREDRQGYLRPVERLDDRGYLEPVYSRHDAIPSKYLTTHLPRAITGPYSTPYDHLPRRQNVFRSTEDRHTSS